MVRAPTSGTMIGDTFTFGRKRTIALTDLTQRGLQAMAQGGCVRVMNHTGVLEGWSGGRVPVESVPKFYVFVKQPKLNLWAQYADTMGGGNNSTAASRRCTNSIPYPNTFDVPGAYTVMSNQSNVQARLRTAIRNKPCYLVELLDSDQRVMLAVTKKEIDVAS